MTHSATSSAPAAVEPLPTPEQVAWQRCETNLFIHFGVNTFTGREWGDGTESPALFNPTQLDCRQWARAAKAGGFRIAILTAKHHDGFCLWPTKTTDHSVASSPWRDGKGDLVREFVDAFRAEGLDVGLYLSPWDQHEPTYGDSPRYNAFYLNQLHELLTSYGPIREVWFDGACGEGPNGKKQQYDWPAFLDKVRQLQPKAVTFGDGGTDVRWVGNEEGHAGDPCWSMVDSRIIPHPGAAGLAQATGGEAKGSKRESLRHGNIDGDVWRPAESDVSIRPGWFYHPEEDDQVRSVDNLVDLYFQSVGRNSLLLLNVPATPAGLLHETDVDRLRAFRQRLNTLFAHDLAADATATAPAANGCDAAHVLTPDPEACWLAPEGTLPVELELSLPEPRRVGIVSLQEPIHLGQRIASHRVEAHVDGQWQELIASTTIGHKRLHRFDPVTTDRLRLIVDQARGPAALSRVALHAGTAD